MAEDKFNSNTRSPRFSTSKALSFRGGSTNQQTGNLQQPTYLQTAGINSAPQKPAEPAAKAAERDINPAISQFSVPKQPGLAATLATGAGAAVAGEAVKQGVSKAGNAIGGAIGNYFKPSGWTTAASGEKFYSSPTMNQSFPAPDNMSLVPGTEESYYGPLSAYNRPEVSDFLKPSNVGDAIDFGSLTDAEMAAQEAFDTGIGGTADIMNPDAIGGATNGIPWVGPALRLAQGDVGGAAGSAAGAAIGSMIFPGVGTAIGGALGGALGGGCFITEAVMSSGGADNGMELEALRGFRDNILSATPQGQAMIAEYEAIAPVVVEAVSARPDGVQIFQQIKGQFIDPAVAAVNAGNFQEALQIYANMIGFVTPFAAEAAEAGMGGQDTDAMNQMGDHAAMVGQSPELAGAAMPDGGGEWDPGTDDDSMMSGGGMMPTGAPMMPQPGMQMPQMAGPAQPPIAQTFARRY